MKTRTINSAITILALITTTAFAKIWRVDNNVASLGDFTTLQAAHDSTGVASGDTLYVYGSPDSYGGLTLTKKLIIFGPGYYLDENPNTQAYKQSAITGVITFNAGSEGSVVTGLNMQSDINFNTSSITLKRNKCDYYYLEIDIAANVSNILIQHNFLTSTRTVINVGASVSGLIISNNYINALNDQSALTLSSGINNATITNNVLSGGVTVYNSGFQNNILRSGTFAGSNNSVFNNIGNSTQFGTDNGNQENVDMSTVVVGTGSTDGQWQIKTDGPADGTGLNGVDCGMFGGSDPYVLSGVPPIPAIYFLNVPGTGTTASGLQVKLKGKSRN